MPITRRQLVQSCAAIVSSSAGFIGMFRARGLKIKIGATDWNLQQEAKPKALALARKIGFDGVEVSLGMGDELARLPLANTDLQKQYRDEARRQEIAIAGTCLNVLHRNYLKSDKLGQKWVADSIPITKALGGRVILLPFFGRGALQTRAEMDYVGDFLKEIGPDAKKTGVVLGLEDTISAEDNVRICDRAQCSAVKVFYDIGNSTNNGFDVIKEIGWLGKDRICEMHFKDNPHYLGEGNINVPAVVDAVADIGYEGWIHLETDSPSRNVEADMGRNLRYMRGLLEKKKGTGHAQPRSG